jgi:hypothetical protein
MEEKLQVLVDKIKNSSLKDDDKEYYFKLLHDVIAGLVWPVLVRYMDEGELKRLASNPAEVTAESYESLLSKALVDGKAMEELNMMVEEVIDDMEERLGSSI